MDDFQLESGHGVTSGTLARHFGVSSQTIANWRNEGMPTLRQEGKAWIYDLKACTAWHAANKGGKRHGGDRDGAGRKRSKKTKPAPRIDTTDPHADNPLLNDPRVIAAETRRKIRDRVSDEPLLEIPDLLHLTYTELLALVDLEPVESGLSKVGLEHLKLIQETRAKHRAELQKCGELVDAREVAEAYGRELSGFRERLEQLPLRLLRAVMHAGEVDPSREHHVLDALRAEIDTIVDQVAGSQGTTDDTQTRAA